MNRRAFLGISAALAGSTLCALDIASQGGASLSGYSNQVILEKINLKYADLPPQLAGFKIGLICDVHLGAFYTPDQLDQAVNLLKTNSPDLLLLGGDYILNDRSRFALSYARAVGHPYYKRPKPPHPGQLFTGCIDIIKQITPRYGTYSVYGNHDHWEGLNLADKIFSKSSVKMLLNEFVSIKVDDCELQLIGVDDYWTGIPEIPKNLPKRRTLKNFVLLLSHNPDFISYTMSNTTASDTTLDKSLEFDLALAGHTHGGQIKLPFFGSVFPNVADRRLSEGLFKNTSRKRESFVYTSRGLGAVELPIRLGSPPEVTVITIDKA